MSRGFRVPGFGFRDSGFRVSGTWIETLPRRLRFSGSGFRDPGFGFRVSGFGFRHSGFGFRDSGFWIWVPGERRF